LPTSSHHQPPLTADAWPKVEIESLVYGARFRQKFTLEVSTFLLVHNVNCVQTLKAHVWMRGGHSGLGCCTVRVCRQEFTLEDAIGSHACSLEALPCV
jgi:hypothetical protein